MPWWCTSLQHIHRHRAHATTTSLERYTQHTYVRDGSGRCVWRKEEQRVSSNEEYFNNACHTIVCSFICLSACSYARLPANSLVHSFVCFLSLGVLFIILFVLVFSFLCECVCVCLYGTFVVVRHIACRCYFISSLREFGIQKRMREESWYFVLILTVTHTESLSPSLLRWCLTQQNRRTVIMK